VKVRQRSYADLTGGLGQSEEGLEKSLQGTDTAEYRLAGRPAAPECSGAKARPRVVLALYPEHQDGVQSGAVAVQQIDENWKVRGPR
jgi:hypothetical protein